MTWHNKTPVNVFYSLKGVPVKPNNENESCRSNTLETFHKNSQVSYKNTFFTFSFYRRVTLLSENISEVFYKFILSSLASQKFLLHNFRVLHTRLYLQTFYKHFISTVHNYTLLPGFQYEVDANYCDENFYLKFKRKEYQHQTNH